MKKVMRKKLLALILACVMLVPATAMADNDSMAPAESTEYVQEEVTAENTEYVQEEVTAEESLEEAVEEPIVETEEEAVEEATEETPEEEGEEVTEEEAVPEIDETMETEEEESSEEESSEEESSEEELKNGFVEKDGKLFYYEDGVKARGLRTIKVDGKKYTYFFGTKGAAVTGYKKVVDSDGNAEYYYFLPNGQAYTDGFLELIGTDGGTYYFYFKKDGTAFTEGFKTVKTRHKANAAGKIKDITDGKSHGYYFRSNGQAYTNGALQFVDAKGKMQTCYFMDDGDTYKDGYVRLKKLFKADEDGTITKISDGDYHYYYFQSNGKAFKKGFLEFYGTDGKIYYFYFQKDGQAYTKGYKACTTQYKATKSCKVSKTSNTTKKYYYFKNDGKAYTNGFLMFVHTDGKTYNFYFQTDGSAYTNGCASIQKRFTADKDGNIQKISDENKYGYRFNDKGQATLIKGWEKVGDEWCWFNESTGVREFVSSWMHTAWNSIKDRSSGTGYYVVVDTKNCRTFTFKGYAGNWKPLFYWKCSPGKPSTPTVKGTFSIYGRGYSFSGKEDFTCYYYTQFYGNYLFHSVLYYKGTFNLRNGTLGKQLSHGCVRLSIENAKWFYQNLGYGTKVYIY